MKTTASLTGLSALFLAMVACGGGESTTPPAPEPAPAAPETPPVTKDDLKNADTVGIVPSPTETAQALEKAGVSTQLATLVPDHKFDMQKADTDHAAIRTGVTLADMLLTVKTAEKDKLLERLATIQTGMTQLGGGADIEATLRDMHERVKADAVTRDELLQEFEELSGAIIPELDFNGNARIVPLIEAGSWLEAANLVARAVKEANVVKAGEASVADDLLKQPEVVAFFIKYVKTEGAEKAPEQVTQQLEKSLTELQNLAKKEGPLDAADIENVAKVTQDVLSLL